MSWKTVYIHLTNSNRVSTSKTFLHTCWKEMKANLNKISTQKKLYTRSVISIRQKITIMFINECKEQKIGVFTYGYWFDHNKEWNTHIVCLLIMLEIMLNDKRQRREYPPFLSLFQVGCSIFLKILWCGHHNFKIWGS